MKVSKEIRNRIYKGALIEFDNSVTERAKHPIYNNTLCRGLCGCLRDSAWEITNNSNIDYPEITKYEPAIHEMYWFPRYTQENVDIRRKILLDAIEETNPNT